MDLLTFTDIHSNMLPNLYILLKVFKFDLMKSKKPLLTLGRANEPGSDSKHFCKPTDVAVDRTGVFYVSDG